MVRFVVHDMASNVMVVGKGPNTREALTDFTKRWAALVNPECDTDIADILEILRCEHWEARCMIASVTGWFTVTRYNPTG